MFAWPQVWRSDTSDFKIALHATHTHTPTNINRTLRQRTTRTHAHARTTQQQQQQHQLVTEARRLLTMTVVTRMRQPTPHTNCRWVLRAVGSHTHTHTCACLACLVWGVCVCVCDLILVLFVSCVSVATLAPVDLHPSAWKCAQVRRRRDASRRVDQSLCVSMCLHWCNAGKIVRVPVWITHTEII